MIELCSVKNLNEYLNNVKPLSIVNNDSLILADYRPKLESE